MQNYAGLRIELEENIRRGMRSGDGHALADPLLRLSDVLSEMNDGIAAAALLPLLLHHGHNHAMLHETVENLKYLVVQSGVAEADPPVWNYLTVEAGSPAYPALRLLGGGRLTEGEYLVVVDDLLRQADRPVEEAGAASALHVMADRAFGDIGQALLFLSQDADVPLLPLARFQPQIDVASQLPDAMTVRRGVLAFDALDETLMVATLNPYDLELQAEVRERTGRNCNFYLVGPSDFDAAVATIRNTMAEG